VETGVFMFNFLNFQISEMMLYILLKLVKFTLNYTLISVVKLT